ncbi:hypothetical protein H112_08487 [Trichophyton rubrum D6]|uniref:Uncharacterized protein n=1 Tax=Trichophyton rubrum CBS 288.86 TaxID=1215330 RepID=A0A022VNU9_TRIRU|nr:hypothetical protein H100_08509 [Trichophyton rubrum MR850]EZF37189.1 hypothetical protein H102_08469 [Trichophyton rubrum CBS 100081]EZF47750.1 hypothetical protein H103_08490 [Trichophyton rubrum CBS 288.86]EZF58541.1 hypothetical protein H104_08444 [Trichophyton rubrum CBS 289.86]EZG11917.1 hypothetical protein H107_08646 [Trichophyton rubrum CBS 202.88]KDB28845.1 hypothetical protein H112_08487 [Trichophyton rubrum D6]
MEAEGTELYERWKGEEKPRSGQGTKCVSGRELAVSLPFMTMHIQVIYGELEPGVTIHMQARYAVQPNQKRLRTLPVVKAQAIVVLVVHREYALTPKLVSGPRNTRCLLHPGPELVLVTSSVLQGRDMPSVAVQPGGRLRRIFAGPVWSMGKVSCHLKRKRLAVLAESIGLESCMQNDGVMVDII